MTTQRARYIDPLSSEFSTPPFGTLGTASPILNPNSAEDGAWCFVPDGSDVGYYVDPELHLELLTP
ncbi:hypothetical protein [Deinococcus soli (ex Cha et al. 2016)]|uniref:Uncharacterized protein n=2 Tax=Deinococcus soli (ex Cha et al. 2016) TaxID=1309411 RepID=A0AAE3XCN2_9DEIO|nr:hypothetical protein [Deinococcus soli (ex Cha et al. 2016)]MDR6218214.1 hypothetical protein [Deinococcus soli (ex Cha et al. 2016)]MDR6328954.1 hypothetical protein [Deinococcus soli (ex Cha et al. 2016)]MDR6751227.1 hypothetical protein [Deinococcus soli (ex Cha et al. 2016)]